MPCEKCNSQFTIFKRKRSCTECRRFYCTPCLSKRGSCILCERCLVFTKRPLLKIDLLKLKPKDLIFYLQSKQISTTGCVEKEELINLVLTHAANNPSQSSQHRNGSFDSQAGDGSANPLDDLKHTCQTLFSSLADNIINFDKKTTNSKPTSPTSPQTNTDQPRVSKREIPTYSTAASQQNSTHSTNSPVSPTSSSVTTTTTQSQENSRRPSPLPRHETIPTVHRATAPNNKRLSTLTTNDRENSPGHSGCECSDDETITTFQLSRSQVNSPTSPEAPPISSENSLQKPENLESSGSSFEELGAVGGGETKLSEESENWQIVDEIQVVEPKPRPASSENGSMLSTEVVSSNNFSETRPSRVTRRRSDGYVYNRQMSDGAISSMFFNPSEFHRIDEISDGEPSGSCRQRRRIRKNCTKCGKSKHNIKQNVLKFAKKLETSKLSEAEFKEELKEFVKFLENRAKSIDGSDSESILESAAGANSPEQSLHFGLYALRDYFEDEFDDGGDEGIHVYAHNECDNPAMGNSRFDSRFLNLSEFATREEIEELSVKQLKEILMLNRVDYKGCCEKQELLERVNRLWINSQGVPAVEKLPTDEICKICMDAPIECVILECGHMATCTNCGKVLSECPICRQYIVRVVRFFKA